MRVLVVNAGSSTLKLSLLDGDDRVLAERQLAVAAAAIDPAQLRDALGGALGAAEVVGHRIVHGGSRFIEAVVIDAPVRHALGELTDLAPLHQPKSLAALDAVAALLPGVPAVACFDTAFHRTMPAAASTYALPARWREQFGIRRYGFHGLSHSWVARRAPALLARGVGELRIVSAHLGAGASLCAIVAGHSVDTTMGFTPLDGLVMATRAGSVDPGALLWLLEHGAASTGELADTLERGSGLLGLTGSADMREVLRRAQAADAEAQLAIEVYGHSLRASIAAMAAAMGGLDALAFTGGVGQHAPAVRALAVDGLAFLGLALDSARNEAATGDGEISAREGSAPHVLVITAREDLEIAHQVRALLAD